MVFLFLPVSLINKAVQTKAYVHPSLVDYLGCWGYLHDMDHKTMTLKCTFSFCVFVFRALLLMFTHKIALTQKPRESDFHAISHTLNRGTFLPESYKGPTWNKSLYAISQQVILEYKIINCMLLANHDEDIHQAPLNPESWSSTLVFRSRNVESLVIVTSIHIHPYI